VPGTHTPTRTSFTSAFAVRGVLLDLSPKFVSLRDLDSEGHR
jgi:hypothetical protein